MPRIVNQAVETSANIKVIGVGGSGANALNHMINSKIKGVEFIAANTDTQDLHNCLAETKIHIGTNLTRGLGAGMDPEIGKRSAEETREKIVESIKGSDMVFIACGMGGGTGTGAAPVIASICKAEGILTIGVCTKPFFFEGSQRMRLAERGLEELEKEVDALITIPNDRILSVVDKNTTVTQAFAMCDEILKQAVEGISEIIRLSGKINLDFNDIRRVLKDSGTALFGIGRGVGESRAIDAANMAISNPLLDISINNATGLLYVIFGNDNDLSILETADASRIITESVSKDAKIIYGIYNDESLKKDEVKITVIASGFPNSGKNREMVREQSPINRFDAPRAENAVYRNTEPVITPPREAVREAMKELPREEVREVREDLSAQAGKRRIENDLPPRFEKESPIVEMKEEKKPTKPSFIEEDTDDDSWDSIPPFLKRKK